MRIFGFILLFLSTFVIGINAQNKVDSLKNVLTSLSSQKEKLQTLDLLTKQMIRKNHSEQKEYISQYMTLAKELEEYDLMAIKSRFLIQQHIYAGNNKKALKLCDSMLSYKDKFKLAKSEAHILLKKGGIMFALQDYNPSITFYDASAELFMKSKDSIFAADAYLFSGQSYNNIGKFVTAIKKFTLVSELYEKLKDYGYMVYADTQIHALIRSHGLVVEADNLLFESVKKAKKYKTHDELPDLFLHIVRQKGIYQGNLSLARKYLDSAKITLSNVKDKQRNKSLNIIYYATETRYFLALNDMKNADISFQKLLEVEKKFNIDKAKHDSDGLKIIYYTKKKRYSKALSYLKGYKDQLSNLKTSYSSNHLVLEKSLSEIYAGLGNNKKTVKHLNNYVKIKDSINKLAAVSSFTFHQAQFKTLEKEKEIIEQEAEIQQLESTKVLNESRRNTLLAILFSIVLIFLGIWWKGRIRRKQLTLEIARNKEELKLFTQQLIQKSGEQEVLKEQLEKLHIENKEKESISIIGDLAASKILTKDDWYYFKEKFVKVYPKFFTNIQKEGYQLTKSEERLVALEKLELDNYEIAKMLGVSTDTIFMSRYRLRKKINAPKEISLINYFEKSL
jgi:DNA-binding CsgD family transcriptional regulator